MKKLPFTKDIESKNVLRRLAHAHRALAELKGMASSIPNQNILINTLGLQEAKDSSAIENIITTHDDLYKAELKVGNLASLTSKEVQNYVIALKKGFELISKRELLTSNDIIEIQSLLEENNAGFRNVPGTTLKNAQSGAVIYTPPQEYAVIVELMANLEQFINQDDLSPFDPLVKMAIIHYQFESIHPFYDGNGRTGRIINILYLVLQGLLDIPVLYLSNYIILHKAQYYKLLQKTRDDDDWEDWLLYLIIGVEQTAQETTQLIKRIKSLMLSQKKLIRENYKFYSQDLLNNLFKHPYTKIGFLENDLKVSRITAANYLNQLAEDGILRKDKIGNSNFYVNTALFEILTERLG